jgi:hypothetical protein
VKRTSASSERPHRACFQVVLIPVSHGEPQLFRLGIIYGIAGQQNEETKTFWEDVANVIKEGPRKWFVIGDYNVSTHRTGVTASEYRDSIAAQAYRKFCQSTGGIDTWELNPDRQLATDWTFRSKADRNVKTMIDRATANTLPGLFEIGVISPLAKGKYRGPNVLATDHRPTLSTLLIPGMIDTAADATPCNSRPRIKFTTDESKRRQYTNRCKQEYDSGGEWPAVIHNQEEFALLYARLSSIIIPVGKEVFGVPEQKRQNGVVFSHKVLKLGKTIQQLNRMIGALKQGYLGDMIAAGKHEWIWGVYKQAEQVEADTLLDQLRSL